MSELGLAPGKRAEKAGARAGQESGSLELQLVPALPRGDGGSADHTSSWHLLQHKAEPSACCPWGSARPGASHCFLLGDTLTPEMSHPAPEILLISSIWEQGGFCSISMGISGFLPPGLTPGLGRTCCPGKGWVLHLVPLQMTLSTPLALQTS